MYTHHRFDHEFPRGTEVRRAYLVCSVPRTGSSLLCELLMGTGVAGAPTEYFDQAQADRFCEVWSCPPGAGYLAALLDRKTGPNGVFGAKVHWGQLQDRFGDDGILRWLGTPDVIHVRRRDQLAQAVSYVIAEQTGRWASTHQGDGEPRYSARAIGRRLDEVRRDDRAWLGWFQRHELHPIEVWYENLVADPRAELERVLVHLGVDPASAGGALATLERQADERNARWVERWRHEHER